MKDRNLNLQRKMILAYVCSFGSGYGCCIRSNEGIAEDLSASPRTISRAIAWLEKHGYVKIDNPYGKNRRVYPNQNDWDAPEQPRQNGEVERYNIDTLSPNLDKVARYPRQIVHQPRQIGEQRVQLEDNEKTKENKECFVVNTPAFKKGLEALRKIGRGPSKISDDGSFR